jgi:single-stranded DNA-binding protein
MAQFTLKGTIKDVRTPMKEGAPQVIEVETQYADKKNEIQTQTHKVQTWDSQIVAKCEESIGKRIEIKGGKFHYHSQKNEGDGYNQNFNLIVDNPGTIAIASEKSTTKDFFAVQITGIVKNVYDVPGNANMKSLFMKDAVPGMYTQGEKQGENFDVFHKVTLFKNSAEKKGITMDDIKEGDTLSISGNAQVGKTYEGKDGKPRQDVQITAFNVEAGNRFLAQSENSTTASQEKKNQAAPAPTPKSKSASKGTPAPGLSRDEDDDIPF